MTTLQDIYSEAQQYLSDTSFRKIQRQEWVDFARDTFFDIADYCKVFPAQQTYIPNPSTAPITPSPVVITIPASDAMLRTVRVKRHGVACREYSYQAIRNAAEGIYPFAVNSWSLDTNNFAALKNADDSYTLRFSSPFSLDEEIVVDYVKEGVALSNTFDDTLAVAHYMKEAVLSGLLCKATTMLFYREDGNKGEKVYHASEQRYDRAKRELGAYIYNLKDEGSFNVVQSFRFLSDNE